MAKFTPDTPSPKKEKFLQAIALTGNRTLAAKLAGCSRYTHYNWLEEDPEYGGRFEEAMAEAADLLEQEARRRAVQGVDKPVFRTAYDDKGKPTGTEVVGHVREYSDLLLIFLLKGAMPEKYRERSEQRMAVTAKQAVDWESLYSEPTDGDVVEAEIVKVEQAALDAPKPGGDGEPTDGDGQPFGQA